MHWSFNQQSQSCSFCHPCLYSIHGLRLSPSHPNHLSPLSPIKPPLLTTDGFLKLEYLMFTTSIRQFSSVGTAVVRSTAASGSSVYESSRAVHEYVQFHFGRLPLPHPDLKAAVNFPQRCAKLTIDHASAFNSALDLGCAVVIEKILLFLCVIVWES